MAKSRTRKKKRITSNGCFGNKSNPKTIAINFISADILSKDIIEGKLHLRLDWGMSGISNTIISKTNTGYNYEDVGHIKKHFNSLDRMMWEFELNMSLLDDIQSLEITDTPFDLRITNSFENCLQKEVEKLINLSIID
jgi:hypothetical protein